MGLRFWDKLKSDLVKLSDGRLRADWSLGKTLELGPLMFRTLGFDELLSRVKVEYGETVEEEVVRSPWAVRSSLFKRTPLTKLSVAA